MKLENNWKHKSLESLEKRNWDFLSNEESYLLTTCYKLTKKPVGDFDVEDLRIMIGQSIGLDFLIPLAIEVLDNDILAEGHFYEGDLLKSVLTSDIKYWKREKSNWEIICKLMENNLRKLNDFDTARSIKKGWFDSYSNFIKIKNN